MDIIVKEPKGREDESVILDLRDLSAFVAEGDDGIPVLQIIDSDTLVTLTPGMCGVTGQSLAGAERLLNAAWHLIAEIHAEIGSGAVGSAADGQ